MQMTLRWPCHLMAVAGLFAIAHPAAAVIVGGGGPASTDCLTVFDAAVNSPTTNPRNVRCTDGSACDADGVINGSCTVPLIVCANSTALPSCTLAGVESVHVDHSDDNGDPKFDPDFQALQNRIGSDILNMMPQTGADVCAAASNIHVAIKGPLGSSCRPATKKVRLVTESSVISGHLYTDTDTIKVTCVPADTTLGGCDPMTLYSSTFDRIQTQIFGQSCALSSCHDSQTKAGNLLLESGASYTQLVGDDPLAGVDPMGPYKDAPIAAGWKRVKVNAVDTTGDPSLSFLYHKLQRDLPDASYGAGMPFNRPKLNSKLRQVITTWILNGAPHDGWVPGTF